MSLATTVSRILACVAAVSGVDATTVFETPRTPTIRSTAEGLRNVAAAEAIQSWEFSFTPRPVARGINGYNETELEVEFVAHWKHVDGDAASLPAFRTCLDAVCTALLDPSTGCPQVKDEGVQVVEAPGLPIRLPTGQSAIRARYRFTLWDTSST